MFPEDIKLLPVNDTSKQLVVDKKQFYSKKISEQASVYGGYTIKHGNYALKQTQDQIKAGRTVRNSGKQYKLVHSRRINPIPDPGKSRHCKQGLQFSNIFVLLI